jgi:hypothetical protein
LLCIIFSLVTIAFAGGILFISDDSWLHSV